MFYKFVSLKLVAKFTEYPKCTIHYSLVSCHRPCCLGIFAYQFGGTEYGFIHKIYLSHFVKISFFMHIRKKKKESLAGNSYHNNLPKNYSKKSWTKLHPPTNLSTLLFRRRSPDTMILTATHNYCPVKRKLQISGFTEAQCQMHIVNC